MLESATYKADNGDGLPAEMLMYKQWLKACVFLLVTASSLWAQDPFGDPFAPRPRQPNDPNRQFRAKADLLESARQQFLEGMVKHAVGAVDSTDDAVFLEGTLSALAAHEADPRRGVPVFDLLHRLAVRRWRASPEETPPEFWVRLQEEIRRIPNDELATQHKLAASYEKQFSVSSPLKWRAREEFWRDFVQLMLKSKTEADVADAWRKRIADDEKHAMLYRRAYAAAAIARKDLLDRELLLPLLARNEALQRRDVERIGEVLQIAVRAKSSLNEPLRLELWGQLEPLLTNDLQIADLPALVQLYRLGGDTQYRLRAKLLREMEPSIFNHFAELAFIPRQERREFYLAKDFKANYRKTPLGQVLREMQAAVWLPLWIDRTAANATTPITLEVTGPWIQVLDQVLAQTEYRCEALHSELYWVGPPAQRTAAREIWERSLARAAAADAAVAERLREAAPLEFKTTPLMDVADYFQDLHRTPFLVRPVGLVKRPITAQFQAIPYHLALELLADQEKLAWASVGGAIYFGAPPEIDPIRELERAHVKFMALAAGRDGTASKRLREPTTLEFIRTPLGDVCAYLSDLHRVPISALGDSHPAITLQLRGATLQSALGVIAFGSGLTWATDGEEIFLGSPAEVEKFQKSAAKRDKARTSP